MKMFKKMAKAIRNVDERVGHSNATAAFIDAEFSDNSGIVADALKSNSPWRKNRVNAICEKAAKIMEDRCVPVPVILTPLTSLPDRVRLYRKGDDIADALLQKKLSREYLRLAHLRQFIFWTGVGRAGALHFKDQLRQKKMAERLRESVTSGLSVEKTQKMIRRQVLVGRSTVRLSLQPFVLSGPLTFKKRVTKGARVSEKLAAKTTGMVPLLEVVDAAGAAVRVEAVAAVAGVVAGVVRRAPAPRADISLGLLLCP